MNIYVGNLSYECTEGDLRTAFGAYGDVAEVRLITDRDSGRSKGFGFVEMPNGNEARNAMDELNGKDFQGRALKVNEAQERQERPRGGGGGGGNRGGGGYGGGGGGGYGRR